MVWSKSLKDKFYWTFFLTPPQPTIICHQAAQPDSPDNSHWGSGRRACIVICNFPTSCVMIVMHCIRLRHHWIDSRHYWIDSDLHKSIAVELTKINESRPSGSASFASESQFQDPNPAFIGPSLVGQAKSRSARGLELVSVNPEANFKVRMHFFWREWYGWV